MPASPIRKLAPLADAAKARGIKVYHLNIGQPDIETPACMRDRLKQLESKVLEYSPSTGTPEFIRSLQRYYQRRLGLDVQTNQILATTGGSEAILFSLMAVANEGDDVMVVEPFYANYRAFATMASLNIVPVTSRGRDGFHMPPRHVWEKTLTPKTRAVMICNPSNPTGTVYTREELDMVAGFCRDHSLFLISDEVYREFVYDGQKAISALELTDVNDFAIVVDSLSKRYSACGIRLGSLVTRNAEVYDACLRMAQGRLSPPGVPSAPARVLAHEDDAAAGLDERQQVRHLVLPGRVVPPLVDPQRVVAEQRRAVGERLRAREPRAERRAEGGGHALPETALVVQTAVDVEAGRVRVDEQGRRGGGRLGARARRREQGRERETEERERGARRPSNEGCEDVQGRWPGVGMGATRAGGVAHASARRGSPAARTRPRASPCSGAAVQQATSARGSRGCHVQRRIVRCVTRMRKVCYPGIATQCTTLLRSIPDLRAVRVGCPRARRPPRAYRTAVSTHPASPRRNEAWNVTGLRSRWPALVTNS